MEKPRKVKICISGLTACGKTTVGRMLAEHYQCSHKSFSDFLLAWYRKYYPNLVPAENKADHFWRRAKKLNAHRLKYLTDKSVDLSFFRFVNRCSSIVFDSFSYPHIAKKNKHRKNVFFVFVSISQKTRTKRALRSRPKERLSEGALSRYIGTKDRITEKILSRIWKFHTTQKQYREIFDLTVSDELLEQNGGSLKSRLSVLRTIISTFVDLFFLTHTKNPSPEELSHKRKRCKKLIAIYYPAVIKAYPKNLTG